MKAFDILRFLLFGFLSLFGILRLGAQEYRFSLLAKDTDIGELVVTKTQKAPEMTIGVSTHVFVKFLGTLEINYNLLSQYKDQELSHAEVVTYNNGKLHNTSKVSETNGGYTIVKDGETSFFEGKVAYTAGMLYTVEPVGITDVFSELDGSIKQLRQLGDHTYELVNPKKKKQNQEYTYENGILKSAVINHPLITLYIERK